MKVSKMKDVNHILNLLERINKKECNLEIELDGSLTFIITNKEINPVHIPEDYLDYSTEESKLVLDDEDFFKFIDNLPTRV